MPETRYETKARSCPDLRWFVTVALLSIACAQGSATAPVREVANGDSSTAGNGDGGATAGAGGSAYADAQAMSTPDAGTTQDTPRAVDAGPPSHATRVNLVDHRDWTRLGPEEDPFDDRPDDVECDDYATHAELLAGESTFGVDTEHCNYVTVRQAARTHVNPGETLVVRLWHFALHAPDPAEAHAVVELDGVRLLDERVPIPAPGGLIKVEMPIERVIPAGAPVYFHLHNHGDNSWALVEISTGPP